MKYIVLKIIDFLYFIYPYKVHKYIYSKKQYIYTNWIKHAFGSLGEGTFINGKFLMLNGAENAYIGKNCTIGINLVLEIYSNYGNNQHFEPKFEMGDNSSIGNESHISCINLIKIGNNVRMGRKIFITDNAHGISDRSLLDMSPLKRPLSTKGPVIIEDCCWIGEMACIMPGVTIGHGTIVGANAVVTHSVPPYCVVAGNPARIIKQL